jgi:hypothetical protein
VTKGAAMKVNELISEVKSGLNLYSELLIQSLNKIHERGIPPDASKIVIWIPLGRNYNLSFTYMRDDACETCDCYPELNVLDKYLDDLFGKVGFIDDMPTRKKIDMTVAEWLGKCLFMSTFKEVELHKVMAINNVDAYIDVNELRVLKDNEMWS